MLESILGILKSTIESALASNDKAAQAAIAVVAVMAIARTIFKPLRALIGAVVAQTATDKDDIILAKVEASNSYKVAAFIVDYVFSLKLPAPKPKV